MHWPADEFPEKWNDFKHAFITISNECALMETRRLKSRSNPWIDSHSLQMMHKRDYLKRKAIAFQDGKLWNFYIIVHRLYIIQPMHYDVNADKVDVFWRG